MEAVRKENGKDEFTPHERALMEKINRQIMENVDKSPDVAFAYKTIRITSPPLMHG